MNIYRPICLPPIPNVIGGKASCYQSKEGNIYYTCAGQGEPLLMIHGINAGASNFEWRCNFEALSKRFRVYAIDLPGFGRSDKKAVMYTAAIYINALIEFIVNEIKEPVHVLSSGLSAAYSCYIAYSRPSLIKFLSLVTPSGVRSNAEPPCEASFTTYNIFTNPIQGDALYNSFVSKTSIRYFLEEFIYSNPRQVTNFVVDYTFAASHQCPNAQYAPVSFIAGFSNIDISQIFSYITQPILVMWGRQSRLSPVDNIMDFYNLNPAIKTYIFDESGLIPQVEEADLFNCIVEGFISKI